MALHVRAHFISSPEPLQAVLPTNRPGAMQGEVLSVGRDERLLLTRAAVLRTAAAGCEVVSAYPAQAPALIEERQFCLLVVGHSLSHLEAAHLALQARKVRPSTKLLATCIDPLPLPVEQLFDAVVDTWAGPMSLVAAVRRLLAEDWPLN